MDRSNILNWFSVQFTLFVLPGDDHLLKQEPLQAFDKLRSQTMCISRYQTGALTYGCGTYVQNNNVIQIQGWSCILQTWGASVPSKLMVNSSKRASTVIQLPCYCLLRVHYRIFDPNN